MGPVPAAKLLHVWPEIVGEPSPPEFRLQRLRRDLESWSYSDAELEAGRHAALGIVFFRLSQVAQSQAAYESFIADSDREHRVACRLVPHRGQIHALFATSLGRQARYREALEALADVMAAPDGPTPENFIRLAELLFVVGDKAGGWDALAEVRPASLTNSLLLRDMAAVEGLVSIERCLRDLADYVEAITGQSRGEAAPGDYIRGFAVEVWAADSRSPVQIYRLKSILARDLALQEQSKASGELAPDDLRLAEERDQETLAAFGPLFGEAQRTADDRDANEAP